MASATRRGRAKTALADYEAKRDFDRTPEPGADAPVRKNRQPIFVVQEHHASRLHYDFRLEADGVLKSWAVPKEPSMDPADKRLAVHVEDHPLSYATFKGKIPMGSYGAGQVYIWDHGTYEPIGGEEAFLRGLQSGKIEFILHGIKLNGAFALVRMHGRGKDNWLLIKMRDDDATPAAEKKLRVTRRTTRAASPPKSEAAPSKIEVTNADKVWFPDDGITKGDVFHYYAAVADRLLPFLRDRPITLERLPDGIGPGKPHFWQKHTPDHYPRWVSRIELPTEQGDTVQYVLVNDEATLLYLVNQGTLTFHPWLSRVDQLDRPDSVLFDLDPGPASFSDAVAVVKELHKILDDQGIASIPKTSGKSGLHVLVAWEKVGGFEEARAWARSIAERVVEAMPDRATVEIRKNKRGSRVYVDTLQNARGKHVVPPYVVRPVAAAPVSMPLEWDELTARLRPGQFTVKTALRRLTKQKSDAMALLLNSFRSRSSR